MALSGFPPQVIYCIDLMVPKASGARPRRRWQEAEPTFACPSRRKSAGFDFDRPDALGEQGVQPPQRRSDELVFARRAGRAHGRKDSSALTGDLFIRGAREPELEFARPVAAVDEVGVAIDERRRDPSTFAVDRARAVAPC